jgi:hypothetical protein
MNQRMSPRRRKSRGFSPRIRWLHQRRETLTEKRITRGILQRLERMLQQEMGWEAPEEGAGKQKAASKREIIRLLNEQLTFNISEANRLMEKPLGKDELRESLRGNAKERERIESLISKVWEAPEW